MPKTIARTAAMTSAVLDLTGMTCAGCVGRVERALARVDGVTTATVNLATQQAQVAFDPARARREDLVAAVVAAGYGVLAPTAPGVAATTGRSAADSIERRAQRRQLIVAAVATLPLLVLAMAHGAIPFADGQVGRIVQFALGSVVLLGPGRALLHKGFAAVRAGAADMNTLVSLGASAAWAWSTVATFAPRWFAHGGHAPHVYFEATAAIVAFVLFGKYLESRARWRLGDAVRALHALVPTLAHRVGTRDDQEEDVPVAALQPGERVRVRPGERVPSDGLVEHGSSAVDESLLSGESVPVDKTVGARVVGGSLVTNGALLVRIDRTGADTALARIAAAVEQAQGSRAPIARFADRVSAVFVPIVLVLALLTFVVWWSLAPTTAGLAVAIERMVAVLVIACPCALGLATPAAIAVGAGRGAELGVLFRTGEALEHASHVDTVVFDKTGTLTNGRPEVVAIEPAPGIADAALLRTAAAVELASEHPFARAVVAAARAGDETLLPATAFVATPAMGVSARVDDALVRVGKFAWLASEGLDVTAWAGPAESLAARGVSPLLVARGQEILGLLGIADGVRPEAAAALARLRSMGLQVAMASGDRRGVAAAVAGTLGIDDVAAELLPADKVARIAALRKAGRRVAMVGDGVNDAPALAAANVGMAMGQGTEIAAAAADVALLRFGLLAVPTALALARATMRTIRRNLLWASVYNLLGLPIAAGLFAPIGLVLSPVVASAAMSLSSVSVLLSSLWLRRFAPTPLPAESR
ncbi:MAG: heavy metal translocating P-type ATPase [Planctomycetes bacterium]|jgi:Cu+-exporting ATPase|nr:heavy metal translocating P-type ATPase [Planctomycetota bacterium]